MLRLIPVRRWADITHYPGMEKVICSFHGAFFRIPERMRQTCTASLTLHMKPDVMCQLPEANCSLEKKWWRYEAAHKVVGNHQQ